MYFASTLSGNHILTFWQTIMLTLRDHLIPVKIRKAKGENMKIGILKEIKIKEQRVCMTPAGTKAMIQAGHHVMVEKDAGVGSGYEDALYQSAGATIIASPEAIYRDAEMVMHVKEPQPSEYPLIRPGQIVFTYLHLAADETLTKAMVNSGCVGIAYETIETKSGTLPLLTPMSEVAGRMAAQQGAKYLEVPSGGMGILLGGR